MKLLNRKFTPYFFVFMLAVVAEIAVVLFDYTSYRKYIRPVPVLTVLLMYYKLSKKRNTWLLSSLIVVLIGDFLYLKGITYFALATLVFALVDLLQIKVIIDFMTKKQFKSFFINLLVFLCFLFLVFFLILKINTPIQKIAILLYSITLAVLAAVSFTNYLNKMTRENAFMFFAVMLQVASDVIYSLFLFKVQSNLELFVLVIALYYISFFCIYKAFILKENSILDNKSN